MDKVLFLYHNNGIVFLDVKEIILFMFDPNFEWMYFYGKDKTFKVQSDAMVVLAIMKRLKQQNFIPVKNYTLVNVRDCVRIEKDDSNDFFLIVKNFGILPGVDVNLVKQHIYYDIKPYPSSR